MPKTFTGTSGKVLIEVSDDELTAMMTIFPSGKMIDEQEILDLIESSGIKYGFEEALHKSIKESIQKDFGIPFPIAICKPNTQKGSLNYYFNTQLDNPRDVDPLSLESLTCITSGTVLADYSLSIFENESSVYNVFGAMQEGLHLDAEHIRSLAGEGVFFDEQHNRLIAAIDGYPYMDEHGIISVIREITITGDVINKTIRIPVSLRIGGDIQSSNLFVGGDLFVVGSINTSRIRCEGNLFVEKNIVDCRESYLQIIGEVECKSLQRSKLITMGKLCFSNELSNCQLIVEKGIKGWGFDSTIHSGNIQSSGSIECGIIGNPDGTSTEIEITISAYLKNLLLIRTREVVKLRQDSEAPIEQIDELNQEIKLLEERLDIAMSDFLTAQREEKLMVSAEQSIFPNTNIRILKHSYQIKQIQQNAQYLEKD